MTPQATAEFALGLEIRQLRESQGLSVRTLAERTGFSASFISQVENGVVSPSIGSLGKIAAQLGTTLGRLFLAADAPKSRVVRAGARPEVRSGWSKATIESLNSAAPSRIDAVLIRVAPGGASGKKPSPQSWEEFLFVLSGTFNLSLAGDEFQLQAGDSVTVPAATAYRVLNTGIRTAELLVVSA
jgi:transcriptional regulator with XRE-family HTH domain